MSDKSTKKKIMRRRLMYALYFLLLSTLLIIIYAYPKIAGAMAETMTIEYGNLQISSNIQCYIVKDEKVYFAYKDGPIGYNFSEGQMARGGSTIMYIMQPGPEFINETDYSKYNTIVKRLIKGKLKLDQNDNHGSNGLFSGISDETGAVISQIGISDTFAIRTSGLISYCLDGYETAFVPSEMEFLDKSEVESLKFENFNFCTGLATLGEPVFKVVNNKEWYAMAWINESELGKYEEGRAITLKLPLRDVTGVVDRVIDNGKDIRVIMKFDAYYEELATLRSVKTEIVTADYSGLIVDNSFITSEDGVPGVHVVSVTGDTKFTPIKVTATDGLYSLVESGFYYIPAEVEGEEPIRVNTVSVYDEIKKVE